MDANGHFSTALTLHFPFTDFASTAHTCTAANSCMVGTSNQANNADTTNSAGALIQNVPPATLSVSSVTGQTVTTAARAGNTVNLAGTNYGLSDAVTAALCDTSGANCDATGITSSTLVVDGTGTLSGGVVVDVSATTGARTVVVTDAAASKTAKVSITILATPTFTISPNAGGSGTSVTIGGTNWNPGSTVTVQGESAVPAATTDAAGSVTASATGSISGSYVVNDATTVSIQATSGALSASQAFSFNSDSCNVPTGGNCAVLQTVHFLANPGKLNQTQAGHDINLGALTLTGAVQHLTGALNQDTVTDARRTSAGWTLNVRMTNLTNGGTPTTNGTIPATDLGWTPACAVTSGGATPTTGSATTLTTGDQLFCSVPTGTGNGIYTANSALNLTVPATADAGTYTAILTLTLS